MTASRHITKSSGGKLYAADLRSTISSNRSIALVKRPQWYEFSGWSKGWDSWVTVDRGVERIRHMCKTAFVYPCAWYNESGWHNNGDEYVARLDTLSPNMGAESDHVLAPPLSLWGPSVSGRSPGSGDVPNEWPWVNSCVNFGSCTTGTAWNYSGGLWFISDSATCPDGAMSNIGLDILYLMQDTDADRFDVEFDFDCFRCHVKPESLVSISWIADVYKIQNKSTKAYGATCGIHVTGKVAAHVPLIQCGG